MEAVPDALDGVDDLEPPRPQYLAKLGDPMIDGASGDREFHPPDLFQEMIAAEGLSVTDHEVFQVPCGLEIRPHIAPGHTPGSTLLEVGDDTGKVLLTGDVIFRGTIGRTDLPGGDLEQMRITLRRIVETFPDETVLLPGHGEPTTAGAEKLQNPYLQADFLKD